MARWGWGDGAKLCDPNTDKINITGTMLLDGRELVMDYVDFVDEERGVYRVIVPYPETLRPPEPLVPKIKDGEAVRRMVRAKHKLKVFFKDGGGGRIELPMGFSH